MITNPFGMHDREGRHLVPSGGVCVDLIEAKSNASPVDYVALRPDINWFARFDWSHHGEGTYPPQSNTQDYLDALRRFVTGTQGVHSIIIGNEPNHENERPGGVVITPENAGSFYVASYRIVKSINPNISVMTPGIAPYHASPTIWTDYVWRMMNHIIQSGVIPDCLACHAYTRSANPGDISSDAHMGQPLEDTYSGFKTYLDFLDALPASLVTLPVDITEFDELDGWVDQNTGVVRAAYRQIAHTNALEKRTVIRSLTLYRYPKYDQWWIEGKQGVIDDFNQAIAEWQSNPQQPDTNGKVDTHLPSVKKPPEKTTSSFERSIDPRATKRGVEYSELPDEQPGWRVKSIRWFDEQEADRVGPDRHILMKALDENGNPISGVPLKVTWPSGFDTKRTENKGQGYPADFPMSPSRNEFGVFVDDGTPSERVTGIGMGMDTPTGFNPGIHTSTEVIFQRTGALKQDKPQNPPDSGENTGIPELFHPVSNPKFRGITQRFGPSDHHYGNVKGHTGMDFATPTGSDIVAVDDGRVLEAGQHPQYGNYVKLLHSWGETVYAHLNEIKAQNGQYVTGGEVIGQSGNTGNSTGPHLHFAMRKFPYNRNDGWDGFTDPEPYLKGERPVRPPVTGDSSKREIVDIIRKESAELGVDPNLMLSLAWGESSFRPHLEDGLYQTGGQAWEDWAGTVGAKDINDPRDNTRVGAVYLRWLISYFQGDITKALTSWNMGIGNYTSGKPVPAITQEFVNKVKHGKDLLDAVED